PRPGRGPKPLIPIPRSFMKTRAVLAALLAPWLVVSSTLSTGPARAAAAYPPGFFEETYASGLRFPMALVPVRRNLFLVGEKNGFIVSVNGQKPVHVLLRLNVSTFESTGICGLALEPGFVKRGYLYVFYTVPSEPPVHRVSRFFIDGKNGPGPEEILI